MQTAERTTRKIQEDQKMIIGCTIKRGLGIKVGAGARREWLLEERRGEGWRQLLKNRGGDIRERKGSGWK